MFYFVCSSVIFLLRFAATFAEVGVKKGDVIHMLLGNSKHFFSACFGTWILGAILSSGEVGQEAKAIADQVFPPEK